MKKRVKTTFIFITLTGTHSYFAKGEINRLKILNVMYLFISCSNCKLSQEVKLIQCSCEMNIKLLDSLDIHIF